MSLVVSQIVFDSPDPRPLAEWWARALGWEVVDEDPATDDEIGIRSPEGLEWLFVIAPDEKVVKNRLHPDLRPPDGSDQATELARLLELGATKVDIGQGDVPWHVLADPQGNELCLLKRTPAQLAAEVG